MHQPHVLGLSPPQESYVSSRTTNMTSIEQQLNLVVVAQPINAIKDADILERLWKDFEDQLWVSESD